MITQPYVTQPLREKAKRVRLLLTDCDGVLTDGSVYYDDRGEALKRFSIRDGIGMGRLQDLVDVKVGIINGETSAALQKRAEALGLTELHMGVADKFTVLEEILGRYELTPDQVAYIGDDTNDLTIMHAVGLAGCPANAIHLVRTAADYVCRNSGGEGAFREFAELIITAKTSAQFNAISVGQQLVTQE